MPLPLSYNLKNLAVRKTTTLMTALGIGLTVAVLLGMGLPALALHDGGSSESLGSPLFHWFSGATMLGAFFIATDPVTAPRGAMHQWLFGLGIGALTFLIRATGAYPDGLAFAVLLGNLAAPALDALARDGSDGG